MHIYFYITERRNHSELRWKWHHKSERSRKASECFPQKHRVRNRKCSPSSDKRLLVKFTSENCLNEAQTNTQARLPSPSSWVHRDNVWAKIDPACTPSWVKPTRTDNNWYVRSSGHWQTHLQRIHLYLATFALTGDISCGFITELAFICIDHGSLSTGVSRITPLWYCNQSSDLPYSAAVETHTHT